MVNGNTTINGDLTIRQLIVSTSVYNVTQQFSSGSSRFGDSLDDTHQFTGSLKITGSITATSFINAVGADFGGALSVSGTDYFHIDDDPILNATANSQVISLLRFRHRGSNGAFTGVIRPLFMSENGGGGQHSVQLYEDGLRIGPYTGGVSAFSNPTAVFEGRGTTVGINLLDLKYSL